MFIFIWWFSSVLFMVGLFSFISNRKHWLSMLLSLENIVLSLFLLYTYYYMLLMMNFLLICNYKILTLFSFLS